MRWAAWGIGRRILVLLAIVLWIGAVVYPDPRPFITSIERLEHPPIDARAVAGIAATLPNSYQAIEKFSLDYVQYKRAYEIYGLPWYFPTVAEVVKDHAGDCQARAVLFASILEAKHMPYILDYSLDHVWVNYPGKPINSLEDPSTAIARGGTGGWLHGLPAKIPLWSVIKVRVWFHWEPMPVYQKALIIIGILLFLVWGEWRLLCRTRRAVVFTWRWIGRLQTRPSEAQ